MPVTLLPTKGDEHRVSIDVRASCDSAGVNTVTKNGDYNHCVRLSPRRITKA
jgi:hypothetical protein